MYSTLPALEGLIHMWQPSISGEYIAPQGTLMPKAFMIEPPMSGMAGVLA